MVDYSPQQDGKVFFGAYVEIENEHGDTLSFRIVGPDEIFGRHDYISIDSPMARALIKKEVDDETIVKTPEGDKEWTVNSIRYWRAGRNKLLKDASLKDLGRGRIKTALLLFLKPEPWNLKSRFTLKKFLTNKRIYNDN